MQHGQCPVGVTQCLWIWVIVDNVAPRAFVGSFRGFQPRTIDGANLYFACFLRGILERLDHLLLPIANSSTDGVLRTSYSVLNEAATAPSIVRLIACILVEQTAEYPLSQSLGFRSAI